MKTTLTISSLLVLGIALPGLAFGESYLRAIPSALVTSPTASNEFTIRSTEGGDAGDGTGVSYSGDSPEKLRFCITVEGECLELPTTQQRFNARRIAISPAERGEAVTVHVPRSLMNRLRKETAGLPQGTPARTSIRALTRSGEVVAELPFSLFGEVSRSALRLNSQKGSAKKSNKPGTKVVTIRAQSPSSQRPSRSFRDSGGVNGNGCSGLDAVFPSYAAYLDCADAAVTQCTQSDSADKAFCIVERCKNLPNEFEGFWRTLDGDSKFVSSSYYKTNFGSATSGEDRFEVALHPCLYDGAGQFTTKFNSSAVVMGDVYPLASSFLSLFHPAKTENRNLSRGDARLSFNGQTLTRILRDDFGATTVPFSYQQELFKSFPRSAEEDQKVYWVNGVIPVYMYFRPQGVIGLELQARVAPESRFLEVEFKSYSDFGTSAAVGPAREGVNGISYTGTLSLIQSEYRTSKYISLNAEENEMLPNVSELSQLEFWPARGGFGPICADWFKSKTKHKEYPNQCSTQVDFGPIKTRQGAVFTARDGRDRLVYYLDRSKGGDDGELTPYPWRNPILSDF